MLFLGGTIGCLVRLGVRTVSGADWEAEKLQGDAMCLVAGCLIIATGELS
jgi:hypothetical protein